MKITAKELHEKSIQQQVTHRRKFEDLPPDQRFKLEAYAEWCNELIAEKESKMQADLISVYSKASFTLFRLTQDLTEPVKAEIDEICRITSPYSRNF
jgi:hypothetical protein